MTKYRTQREIGGYLVVSDSETSLRMAGIRQKNTSAEIAVRRVLTNLGLRYRVNNRDLPGSPDIANRSRRWAVFVHGCYWHRHTGCKRATTPRRNRDFWIAKFVANTARDERAVNALNELGYTVVVVWECETGNGRELQKRLSEVLTAIHGRSDKRL